MVDNFNNGNVVTDSGDNTVYSSIVDRTNSPRFLSKFSAKDKLPEEGISGNDFISNVSRDTQSASSFTVADTKASLHFRDSSSRRSFTLWCDHKKLLKELEKENIKDGSKYESVIGLSSADILGSVSANDPRETHISDHFVSIKSSEGLEILDGSFNNIEKRPIIHNLMFAKSSILGTVNNDVICFLLKNFPRMEGKKLVSAPSQLSIHIEKFRAGFFDIINKEHNSISLKVALLRVAFNNYSGNVTKGYLTFQEYNDMMSLYIGTCVNTKMVKAIFDSMDRNRKAMIKVENFIAGMLACSPYMGHKIGTAAFKLRLQHIFRLYDLKRQGYLDRDKLKMLLGHLVMLSRDTKLKNEFPVGENSDFMGYNANSPLKMDDFTRISSQISEDNGIAWGVAHQCLDNLVDKITDKFGPCLGYDAFYSCVETGIIKNTNLLLRSNKDFADSVMEHIIFALSHTVIKPVSVKCDYSKRFGSKEVDDRGKISIAESNRNALSPIAPLNYTRKAPLWTDTSGLHLEKNLYDKVPTDCHYPKTLQCSECRQGDVRHIDNIGSIAKDYDSSNVTPTKDLYNFPGLNLKRRWSSSISSGTSNIVTKTDLSPDTTNDKAIKSNLYYRIDEDPMNEEFTFRPKFGYGNKSEKLRPYVDSCLVDHEVKSSNVPQKSVEQLETPIDSKLDKATSNIESEENMPLIEEKANTTPAMLVIESSLDVRVSELCRRYRSRYLGFNTSILVDNSVALKIFKGIYRKTFKAADLGDVFSKFEWCTFSEIFQLCDAVCTILRQEDSLLKLQGDIQVHGPMKGDIICLIDMFNTYGWPLHSENANASADVEDLKKLYARGEPKRFLFLGGLISDLDAFSLELVLFLFSLKVLFPYHIYFLRGGDEIRLYNYKSSFYKEIYNTLCNNFTQLKLYYDEALLIQCSHEVFHKINDVFEFFSIGAIIGDRILCLYGFISNCFSNVDQLSSIPKPIVVKKIEQNSKPCKGKCNTHFFEDVHIQNALFGTLLHKAYDGHDVEFECSNWVGQDQLLSRLKLACIAMVITSNENISTGYKYLLNEKILQLSTSYISGRDDKEKSATIVVIKESANKQFHITHKSLKSVN